MKIDFKRLNALLEAKASRAIDRLDGLKCYTDEFQETLDSIVYMLEVSKDLEQYDTECPDCMNKEKTLHGPEQVEDSLAHLIGQVYEPFGGTALSPNRLVLFYSDQCQPCQYLKPILEDYASLHGYVLEKVLVDDEAGINHAQRNGIQGWPTVLVIINDVVRHTMRGADVNAPVEVTQNRLHKELGIFF